MRDRLHNYTKRTLGAGGSMNEAVSSFNFDQSIEFDAGGVNFLAVESLLCVGGVSEPGGGRRRLWPDDGMTMAFLCILLFCNVLGCSDWFGISCSS